MPKTIDKFSIILKPDISIKGTIFPEPIKIINYAKIGDSSKVIGKRHKIGISDDPVWSISEVQTFVIKEDKILDNDNPYNFQRKI